MPTPATQQLVHRVRRLIIDRELSPDDRLGTERALAEQLGVGRGLLRQALTELETEGVLRRAIGRAGGIIVSDGKIQRGVNTISSVPAFVRQQGYRSETRVISATLTPAGAEEARALGLVAGQPIYSLVRLRLADGRPLSYEHARLPTAPFPGLLQQPLDGSLYQLLHTHYGCDASVATESIEAVHASAEEAEQLELGPDGIVLRLRRITLNQHGQPIEFARDSFRADRTRIHSTARGLENVVIPLNRPEPQTPGSAAR